MNKTPRNGMEARKRIALAELQVLVSLLVKFSHNNHGAAVCDIWKPTWWPRNIRFTYPIQRKRNISPAMWRKDLVTIITNYYFTTRNAREHLNGRDVLNNSDFLWEIPGELFHNNNNNNNDNATVIKPNRSNRENSVQLSENTLKRLMPRLEVRLVDILATEEYRKFRENSQQSRQKEFLRNLSLITVPEFDNMNLGARYTFRASTKLQSDGQQCSSQLQIQQTDEETTVETRNEEQLVEESKQTSVEEDIVVLNVVDKTVDKNCLQEKQVDISSCELKQSFPESTFLIEKANCSLSSSKNSTDLDELSLQTRLSLLQSSLQEKQEDVSSCESERSPVLLKTPDCDLSSSVDLDELSIKARVSLLQCSPSYVHLNKASNERRRRRMQMLKKRRVLQPRRARMISRMKINSNYVSKWKKAVK